MRQNRFVGRWRWFCGSSRRVSPAAEASWSLPGVFWRVSQSSWSTVGWNGNTQQREEEQFLRTSWSWAAAVRASNQNPSPKPNHRNAWEQRYVTLAIDLFSCKVWGRVALCNYSLDTFAAQQRSTYFIKLVSSWDGFQETISVLEWSCLNVQTLMIIICSSLCVRLHQAFKCLFKHSDSIRRYESVCCVCKHWDSIRCVDSCCIPPHSLCVFT